ncbi:hypothetical protein B7494_g5033 [Chlorociboria aeruginascens]|nr:hypothetical protein B7494_g5033 [Chlorociboria aeruginascens]
MPPISLLLILNLILHLTAAANWAYGFTANTFLTGDGFTYYNHAIRLAYPEARNHSILLNITGDYANVYCPYEAGCPTPTPENVKTQFNTTVAQGDGAPGPSGRVFMNSQAGVQLLYVDGVTGLLSYTAPGADLPSGSYADLFSLEPNYEGSQLEISTPALLFNDTLYWFSCPAEDGLDGGEGLNVTYANLGFNNETLSQTCLQFALLSDAAYGFSACPYNPTTSSNGSIIPTECGFAAWENLATNGIVAEFLVLGF